MLKIANKYGNFDVTHSQLPKGYTLVEGKCLQPLARKHGIKFVPAVTEWIPSRYRKYPSRPKIGGIVVTDRQAAKMCELIAERERRRNDPKVIAAKQRAAKRRQEAADRHEKELDERAARVGYERGSKCEAWLKGGCIDERDAEVIAFKTRYRHEFTDYDEQYEKIDWQELKSQVGFEEAKQQMREMAREEKVEDPIPETWDEYLRKYGFDSPEALAMAAVLRNPRECHPVWFKACEVGLRGRELTNLTYERIKDAKVGTPRD
ncbi:MAG: hypothetical protein C0467_23265 [Planctomycetaceae bacterium]|nr:hypothetical protein [Planctomycetaceae bacterium]